MPMEIVIRQRQDTEIEHTEVHVKMQMPRSIIVGRASLTGLLTVFKIPRFLIPLHKKQKTVKMQIFINVSILISQSLRE